jgi:hypothetical protein
MKWIEYESDGTPYASAHCNSRAHCVSCRTDAKFRESLLIAGLVEKRDFACPFRDGKTPPVVGPGTRLKRILARLGLRETPTCACRSMRVKMDAVGNEWCREHMDEILGVMREAAADPVSNPMKLPFIEWGARKMILHCAKE